MAKFKFSIGMIYDIIPILLLIMFGSINPVLLIASISLAISGLLIELNSAKWLMLGLTVIYMITGFMAAFSFGNMSFLETLVTSLILTKSIVVISKICGELF